MDRIQRGIWSGILATSAMTLGFMELFPSLPVSKQSPLPPGTITHDLIQKLPVDVKLSSEGRQASALAAHFGYGILFALIYQSLADKSRVPAAVKGAGFGLFVWTFSYLGLLPALGVRSRAPNMPLSRNLFMILNHIVWGMTLGKSEQQLRQSGQRMFDGKRRAELKHEASA